MFDPFDIQQNNQAFNQVVKWKNKFHRIKAFTHFFVYNNTDTINERIR